MSGKNNRIMKVTDEDLHSWMLPEFLLATRYHPEENAQFPSWQFLNDGRVVRMMEEKLILNSTAIHHTQMLPKYAFSSVSPFFSFYS